MQCQHQNDSSFFSFNMTLPYLSLEKFRTSIHFVLASCILYSLYYNTMFYDECISQFLSRAKTKHLPSSVCKYNTRIMISQCQLTSTSSVGKHCAITDYSFMSTNSTLHLLRTAKDNSPDTAVYYNVHDLSRK